MEYQGDLYWDPGHELNEEDSPQQQLPSAVAVSDGTLDEDPDANALAEECEPINVLLIPKLDITDRAAQDADPAGYVFNNTGNPLVTCPPSSAMYPDVITPRQTPRDLSSKAAQLSADEAAPPIPPPAVLPRSYTYRSIINEHAATPPEELRAGAGFATYAGSAQVASSEPEKKGRVGKAFGKLKRLFAAKKHASPPATPFDDETMAQAPLGADPEALLQMQPDSPATSIAAQEARAPTKPLPPPGAPMLLEPRPLLANGSRDPIPVVPLASLDHKPHPKYNRPYTKLGEGSYGAIFEMVTQWGGQAVAVKVAEAGSRSLDSIALYQRHYLAHEMAVLEILQGPAIVPLLGMVTVPAVGGGQAFAGYIMPIADAGDVFDIIDEIEER
ncbi:hypothetical protein WJX73_008821 [Symbiochloris irregularis]|uniref:Protein kinase domain-containing protein n=1 Tax=Symbiochloris irregularis TaxID=706552 RepID=A0AAW1PUE8_9CHLO